MEPGDKIQEMTDSSLYQTDDKMMCLALMMAGHTAVKVNVFGSGMLVYVFNRDEVWEMVEAILTGRASSMTFTYESWWKAENTWQMNLRHIGSVRRK